MALEATRTQLILVLRATSGMAGALTQCATNAARTAPVATVILEQDPSNPLPPADLAEAVAGIQRLEIATLIFGDPALARIVKADGVHMPCSKAGVAAYREAREILGSRFIVGLDAGRTRHDAMTAGEEGTDYVAFGIPAFVEDQETARARRLELIAWWADIFEVPCVAFDVETPEDARKLAEAGADFVALRLPPGTEPQSVTTFLDPFVTALRPTRPDTSEHA